MKMKVSLFLFFGIIVPFFLHSQTHINDGPVSGIWNVSGSPYIIHGNCFVPQGLTLTIQPNVVVKFDGNVQLAVNGGLFAQNASFVLVNPSMGKWLGIRFNPTSLVDSFIKFCFFSNAMPAIVLDNSSPRLEQNEICFENYQMQGIIPDYVIKLLGSSSPIVINNLIENYASGIFIRNLQGRNTSNPVIVNTRVRNSPESARLDGIGLEIEGNVSIEIRDCFIEDYPTGIKYTGTGIQFAQTPVITNTRVRESGESSRQIAFLTGIEIMNVVNVAITGDSISSYPLGISIVNDLRSRDTARPVIANTRVRESAETARQIGTGISLSGNISATIDNCDIEDFDTGILYLGTGLILRDKPVITNTRVRESTESARETILVNGIKISEVVDFEINNVEIYGYNSGIDVSFTRRNGRASSPTITNTRVRESAETSRLTMVGINLTGDIQNAEIAHNELVDCQTAIFITGNNNHVHHNVIYPTGLNFLQTGISSETSFNLQVYHNTLYNCNVSLAISNTQANLYNNIFWHTNPVSSPIVNHTANVSAINYNNLAMPSGNPTPAGIGNINQNPLFVDPANYDFRLTAGSPCINAGNPASPLSPDGSYADMGAIPYQETGSQSQQQIIPPNDDTIYDFPDLGISLQFVGTNSATTLYITTFSSNPGISGELPPGIENIATTRYWRVVSTIQDAGFYEITFDLSGILGIYDFNTLKILKRDNAESPWVDVTSLGAVVTYAEPFITVSGLHSFSEFVPGGSVDNPLPVTLGSFLAQVVEQNALLIWNTLSEVNLSHWNIYRAVDLNSTNNFVINPSPIWAAGTSMTEQHYSYEDSNLDFSYAQYYYWLESIDYSGMSNVHGPVILSLKEPENPEAPEVPLQYGLQQNYPNPFNPNTTISFVLPVDTIAELQIFNCKGQLVRKLFFGNAEKDVIYNLEWNGEDAKGQKVTSGIYLYQLRSKEKVFTKKMIVLQ
jgi:hypothetical protein